MYSITRVHFYLNHGELDCLFLKSRSKFHAMSDRPLLDIVAGTSIGAINAAIIVSYVVENNTWDGSSDSLNEFWEYLSKESPLDQVR
jgi:hypothetical protein